jgi:hypothetical protein
MALPPHQIVRFLRLIGLPACRGEKRVPLSVIAILTGGVAPDAPSGMGWRPGKRRHGRGADADRACVQRVDSGVSVRADKANCWEVIEP